MELKDTKHRKAINFKIRWVFYSAVVVCLLASSLYFYKGYNDLRNNPSKAQQQETNSLISEVEKLYKLPKDETPTIADVKDKDKLKDQPFFSGAENGDKLLIYTNAKQAIVYRPSEKKIINVGPIAITDSAAPKPE
jgi:hypothetical protein